MRLGQLLQHLIAWNGRWQKWATDAQTNFSPLFYCVGQLNGVQILHIWTCELRLLRQHNESGSKHFTLVLHKFPELNIPKKKKYKLCVYKHSNPYLHSIIQISIL